MCIRDRVRAACVLFSRCVDLEDGGLKLMLSTVTARDVYYIESSLGMYACFKGCNPSGHYVLNLSLIQHRMLAIRLRDCSTMEGRTNLTWHNVTCGVLPLQVTLCPFCCSVLNTLAEQTLS